MTQPFVSASSTESPPSKSVGSVQGTETARRDDPTSDALPVLVQALCRLAGATHVDLDGAVHGAMCDVAPYWRAGIVLHYRRSPVGWLLVHHATVSGVHTGTPPPRLTGVTPPDDATNTLPECALRNALTDMSLPFTRVYCMTTSGVAAPVDAAETDACSAGAVQGVLVLANDNDAWAKDVDVTAQSFADALHAASTRQRLERADADRSARQGAALARMRATLAAMHELVLEFDEDGVCIDVHCTNERLLRQAPDALLHRSLEETLPDEIAQLQRQAMAEAREKGMATIPEYRLSVDGEVRTFSLTVSRRSPIDGRYGYVFVIRDITELRQRETENARLGQITRAMINMAATLDDKGRITWVNSAFERHVGAPLGQLQGRPYLDTLSQDGTDNEAILRLKDALRTGETTQVELSRITPLGQRWISVSLQSALPGTIEGSDLILLESDITQRRAADEERRVLSEMARSARKRLQSVIKAAGIGTWELCLRTRETQINDQWAAIVGYEPNDSALSTQKDWTRLWDPADRARLAVLFDEIISGRRAEVSEEIKLRHRDGQWRHVLIRGQCTQRSDDGTPLRLSGIGVDVTERRMAEERLTSIHQAARIGTWVYSGADGTVQIDTQYAQMLGYTVEELSPYTIERFHSLVHPDDLEKIKAGTAAVYSDGLRNVTHEYRARHKDGSWRWIQSKARVLDWISPTLSAMEQGVTFDITEQRQREAALAEANEALQTARQTQAQIEQRLADIASASDDWFWETDADGCVSYLSSGFERSTGIDPSLVYGVHVETVLQRFTTKVLKHPFRDMLAYVKETRTTGDMVVKLPSRDGRDMIYIRLNGAAYFDENGFCCGLRGVGTNVTAMMRARELAEAANQAKSRFLANMSHELRTPLTAVLGMTELLADTRVDAMQTQMIDTIRSASEGLLTILNDILDLAKIEAGKLTVEWLPFVPADMMLQARPLYEGLAQAKGLDLSVHHADVAGRGYLGDANRLKQILHNLVTNAVKFTEKGRVHIELRRALPPEKGIVLTVSDTGIGMDQGQKDRVFHEFEQAEGSTARRFGGTGLGLSISRHLCQLMGGSISIDTQPGVGTEVTVCLPFDDAQITQPSQPQSIDQLPATLRGLSLLVADDNATNRTILRAMLSALGAEVTLVNDGYSAVTAAQSRRFDVLLLDISMPGIDGIETLRRIGTACADAGQPMVPAFAVTANAMSHQVAEYLENGFSGHIPKPFNKQDFLRLLGPYVANV